MYSTKIGHDLLQFVSQQQPAGFLGQQKGSP